MDPILTTCTLDCPDRCSILCDRVRGKLRLRGDPDHPYTRGFTCAKIHRYPARLSSPHRIREPWVKRSGQFHPVDWDEAMGLVAERLSAALEFDPRSVLWHRGGGSMGLTKAFADYFFTHLGARGTRGTLCDGAGCEAVAADAGTLDMNDPAEIDAAEVVVLWGKNPKASSVHLAAQVSRARRRGARVLAVNPDLAGVASLADDTVLVGPGGDRYLALACAKLLLEGDALRVRPEQAANGAEFLDLLQAWSTEDLLDRAGVPSSAAGRLADAYQGTPRVATVVGWGVQRYPWGGAAVRAIHALAFLAGTLEVTGGGFYFSIPSSRHLSRPKPDRAPGPSLLLPELAGEIENAAPPIRFAWLSCSNLFNQAPDAKRLHSTFSQVDDVVTVDGYWTETARRSTVVLPAALWLEEEDVVGSYWRNTVALARQVSEPPEGCRTDFDILAELAARLDLGLPYPAAEDWLAACLPPGGSTLGQLREAGWVDRPWPRIARQEGFAHADGRFHLLTDLGPEADPTSELHPFRLISGVGRRALHSQLLPEEQRAPLPIRLHPRAAEQVGAGPGDALRLVSHTGELEGEAHLDPLVHPEAVCCERGGWISLGVGINEVTAARLTDLGEGTAYYDTRVRVEKPTGPASSGLR